MTIQHLTPSDYITTKWSGGLTTQLGIAPRERGVRRPRLFVETQLCDR